MAGGAKLTPRQRMINLMYLIFIAMMALQMSKEVLSAFDMVNDKLEMANKSNADSNDRLLNQLEVKAQDEPKRFGEPYQKALEVKKITKSFYDLVAGVKQQIVEPLKDQMEDGKLPAEKMEKGDVLDKAWFAGDKYSAEGEDFVKAIEKYKSDILAVLGNDTKYQPIRVDLQARFDLADVKRKDGIVVPYLNYNFQGFPAIASLTKLSTMQNDAITIAQEIYNSLLGNTLTQAASMSNYRAIVISEKSAYFAGEPYKGIVVLGRYDDSTVPTEVVVNGQKLDLSKSLDNGRVNLSLNTGNVGEHEFKGKFTFMEDGKAIPVDFTGNYVVVPKPNQANISADKMNVVYRGVVNPMTITFAGISDDKVQAIAPGLSKAGKPGQYSMRPQAGREVVINVTGKLPDGTSVSDKKMFRIKDIPAPRGTVRGEYDAKGPKSNLEIVTIGARLEDFDFELGLTVTGFVLQVPGQPSVVVQGNRMNDRAKAAISKARLGDVVVISDIKVRLDGSSDYQLKKTAPCTYEIM